MIGLEHLRPGPPKRPPWTGPTVFCYICGRQYGTHSIGIHQPKCLDKWRIENARLPKHMRKAEPVKPDVVIRREFAESAGVSGDAEDSGDADAAASFVVDHEATNAAYFRASLEQLHECRWCGRRFGAAQLIVHQRSCTCERPARSVRETLERARAEPRLATTLAAAEQQQKKQQNQRQKQASSNPAEAASPMRVAAHRRRRNCVADGGGGGGLRGGDVVCAAKT